MLMRLKKSAILWSPSSRRAWIEILPAGAGEASSERSPSSRRAWIEIGTATRSLPRTRVALLAEGVDRNSRFPGWAMNFLVALLAEGVDRNCIASVRGVGSRRRPPRGGRG